VVVHGDERYAQLCAERVKESRPHLVEHDDDRQESNEIERQACYPSEFRFGPPISGLRREPGVGNLGPGRLLKRFRVFHHRYPELIEQAFVLSSLLR
jgi:hypothetical protein